MESLLQRCCSKVIANCRTSYIAVKSLRYNYNRRQNRRNRIIFCSTKNQVLIGSSLIGFGLSFFKKDSKSNIGVYKKGLPDYTPQEVEKHKTKETRIWVTYKEGVYDITDYIEQYSESVEFIKEVAGKPIELLYNEDVYKAFKSCRIGNLKTSVPISCCDKPKENSNHYECEPIRDERLKPLHKEPFVGGPMPTSLLTEQFLTQNELCYIHNHMPVPDIDLSCYKLCIEIEGREYTKSFTLDELKNMPQTTVIATMQCASNRSMEMAKKHNKCVQDAAWEHNAISTVEWTGVLLSDVLKSAGLDKTCECNQHIQFESVTGPTGAYMTSIPIWRMANEKCQVLLAFEMNGIPLSRDHGHPLRVIIPGVAATRWVKWLSKIRLQEQECNSEWQKKTFKLFGPNINCSNDLNDAKLEGIPSVQEMPVTSAICKPSDKSTVEVLGGQIIAEGYAYSGGGQKIMRVEVSVDKGKTWIPAKITCKSENSYPYHWTWAMWTVNIPISRGTENVEIWSKATDYSFNTQPENWQWNFSGVGCNTVHKIKIACK